MEFGDASDKEAPPQPPGSIEKYANGDCCDAPGDGE